MAEFDQYIGQDGTVFNFDDQVDKFLMTINGQGMPPIRHITQRGAEQHGETWLDYRLLPRSIRLVYMGNQGYDRSDFWATRSALLDGVRPNRGSGVGTLRKQLDDGTRRDIDVIIANGPTLNQQGYPERGRLWVRDSVEFIAHDPIFYDPTSVTVTASPSVNTELEFSVEFPIEFGLGVINTTEVVAYSGTWFSLPVITLTGPMDNPVVSNDTLSKIIQLDYSVADGEVVTIDLAYGAKTITNASGTDLIGTLTSSSDLTSWRLECDPIAASGNNSVTFEAGGTGPNSQFDLTYYKKYIGI